MFVENQSGRKIKKLRTDNGLEFCSNEFDGSCKNMGIGRHKTVPKTPQQNGVAERMNRTILERVRCMLILSGLPKMFWAEASVTACYLINRCPSAAIDFKTPIEARTGKNAKYDHLRTFGCVCYAHMKQDKLDPRARKCIFLGYPEGVKGYKLMSIEPGNHQRFFISRDVKFDEEKVYKDVIKSKMSVENSESMQFQVELEADKRDQAAMEHDLTEGEELTDEEMHTQEEEHSEYLLTRDRQRRQIRPPDRFGFADIVHYALVVAENEGDEPLTYEDAMKSENREDWKRAMYEEMESLQKNDTWILIMKPTGQRLVGCRWIFKYKEGIQGVEKARFKARLVARGFTQREGIDYNEIFSPVVKHTSIRMLLSLVATEDLELEQLDVKTAFLHGDLEEDICMSQPRGFEVQGKEDHVCLLKKSLYGLKQSPRQWYKKFDEFVLKIGFKRSAYDSCVYVRRSKALVYLLLYVDDMLIASKDSGEINKVKLLLSKEFDMKDLGPARKILGIEIVRDKNKRVLKLSQGGYINKVLKKYGFIEVKTVSTPMGQHFKLSHDQAPRSDEENEIMSKIPYTSVVGSIMYIMVCTRPDLSHAVSIVSRYMSDPGTEHWNAVKWIVRYLKGTSNSGLIYGKASEGSGVIGFVDSDYAGDLDSRRSQTGFVFQLNNCTISWKANLQSVVALSTTEAEYMASTKAVKEAIWLKGLSREFGVDQQSVPLMCDSQSALHLSKNQVFHERTKHIDVRLHFIRDIISEGKVNLQKISTEDNPADMLTKALTIAKFKH